MKFSRRDFIHAGCAVIATTLAPHFLDVAKAGINNPGSGSANGPNNSRVTVNADNISYLNLAKGFGYSTSLDPTTVSSDGYPASTPASQIFAGASPSMPANYYGTFTWSWSGEASMLLIGAPPMVVTSGGTPLSPLNANSGDLGPGNASLTSATAPSVVFAFGWNIQSISSGSGGVITINTKTSFVASGSGYTIINNTVNITGANANTGANGTWKITNLTASSFDLVGSTFTNAQAGAAGQAIFAAGALDPLINNTGTFSSWSNLVWCRTGDVAAIAAGQIIDNNYINELKYLFNQTGLGKSSAGWIRFMDASGVQTSFESDFSQRIPATNISYNPTNTRAGYWTSGGTITNNGSDAYTCADPSVSTLSAGVYLDNAIVQGKPSATNTGGLPTLAVGTGPAKPIFNYNDGSPPFALKVTVGATSPGTDVLQFTFTQTSWTNPQLNGGVAFVFSYTTVAGDGTALTLQNNLMTAFSANATLSAAKIFFANRQNGYGPFVMPRSAQAGRMTLAYTSGTATITVNNCKPSAIGTGVGTFIYNYLLDGWIYQSGGMICSLPYEAMVDMCNRSNAHCWDNYGFTRGANVTAKVNFFGDPTTGLTSGLRYGFEAWNEFWNSTANPYSNLVCQGEALGWSETSFQANFSFAALRTIQYAALARAAWSGKGRNASDFYVFMMHQLGEAASGNFDTSVLKGTSLVTSNATYNSYGALNGTGTAVANYNSSPNRPVDISTAIGQAPYWNSKYLGNNSFTQASQLTGTTTQELLLLVAANNFGNGAVSTAFASLVNQFNRVGTVGPNSFASDFVNMQTFFTDDEGIASQYDSGRSTPLAVMHYEAGPSFGMGNNGNNGVNSLTFNTVLTADITALANQITSLGWNVSTWTISGTNNATEMATMILQMLQAWKFDVDNNGNAFGSGSYKNMIEASYYQALKTTSGANRETKPCQYSVAAQNWAFWPASIYDPNPYQNRTAMHEWNAGN